MTSNAFRIEYPTRYMELNVGEFFSTANKKQVAKALKLAKQHCSDIRRDELIDAIAFEIDRRDGVIAKLESLRMAESSHLWEFFPQAYIEPSSYEKTLRKQRDKLTENAELVKKARWDG